LFERRSLKVEKCRHAQIRNQQIQVFDYTLLRFVHVLKSNLFLHNNFQSGYATSQTLVGDESNNATISLKFAGILSFPVKLLSLCIFWVAPLCELAQLSDLVLMLPPQGVAQQAQVPAIRAPVVERGRDLKVHSGMTKVRSVAFTEHPPLPPEVSSKKVSQPNL